MDALGTAGALECLRPYEVDTHFCTWAGERTGTNREGVYAGVYSLMEKAANALGPLLFVFYGWIASFITAPAALYLSIRFWKRPIVATCVFMAVAGLTVFIRFHL